jgi:hypothetical protein
MAGKDLAEKYLESYNDVFADIVNVLLFHGEKIVDQSDLEECGTESIYKIEGGAREQNRDIAKLWKKKDIIFSFIGLENQTKPDKDMPLRIIGYDGARYRDQYQEYREIPDEKHSGKMKKEYLKHYPVISIILYFGTEPWQYPTNLKGCFDCPDYLEPYVKDYEMNLFQIAYLSEETLLQFTSDFGVVANYFVQKRLGKQNFSKEVIRHVDAVMYMMKVLTGDDRFEDILINGNFESGGVTMCEYLDAMINEGRNEGRIEGRNEGKIEGILEGKILAYFDVGQTPEMIAEKMKIDVKKVEAVLEKNGMLTLS